jgi:hypothetical protein
MPVKFEKFDSELMESLCAELLTPKENERKQVLLGRTHAFVILGDKDWIDQLRDLLHQQEAIMMAVQKAILLSEVAQHLNAKLLD